MKILIFVLLCLSTSAAAQSDAITVTGTRVERPSLDVPASIDRIDGEDIRWARPMVNLSESLGRVPGIVVQNRQNYAQDLQITSRGFGARASFGVRGLRLITDGIPASFPDGQGQVSHFDLSSAGRIEVLRGPFAVMYGNSSGGIINLITESGADFSGAAADLMFGSYGTTRAGFKLGSKAGESDWIVSGSRFDTDGYRDHSAATREQVNAKASVRLGGGTSLTLVVNAFNSPETQDPQGLSRAQMDANPRQVAAGSLQFDTRKSLAQTQGGATLTHELSASTSLSATAFAGHRDVRQYLSTPLANQTPPGASGGVVDLDRDYGGVSVRMTTRSDLFGRPLTLVFGGEHERMTDRRKGFINNFGAIGALKRDEDNIVSTTGLYAQAEWRFAEQWLALAGLRTNRSVYRLDDFFVAAGNPDDSGQKRFGTTTPVGGILYKISASASLYANAGRGFETPTFAELAYRSGATGLNTGLGAARSRHLEAGLKAILDARTRINLAWFDILTRDEIVVDTNSGGRQTFKNASRTRRNGLELALESALPRGFEALLAWTLLDAKFLDPVTSTASPTVPAGNVLPATPRNYLYGELRWREPVSGFSAALEVLRKSRIAVNDLNSEFAEGYAIANLALGFAQRSGSWRFSEFLRIDNLGDKRYAGSVIVNDANGRFYEPAPGRALFVGAQAKLGF